MGARGGRHFVVAIALYILAATVRLWCIGSFITFDEVHWAANGAHFLHGLITGNWLETVQFAAPGVFTMWAAALPAFIKVFVLGRGREAWDLVSAYPVTVLPLDEPLLRAAAFFLPESRVVLALLNALRTPVVYLLLIRLGLTPVTAFLGAALAALDPFVVGHDRVLHTDGPAATFFLPALLALLVGLESSSPKGRWVFVSGSLAMAALLSKSTGGLVIPTLFVLLLLHAGRPPHARVRTVKAVTSWMAGAIAAAFVFWPALWGGPIRAVRAVLDLSLHFAGTPHPTNYFLGKAYVEEAPGPLFYLVSLPTRTTPLIWLGILLALPYLTAKTREGRLSRAIWLAIVLFLVPVSLSAKEFERYLLPLYPPLAVLAALGWTRLATATARFVPRRWSDLLLGLIVALQGGAAIAEFPYYFTYLPTRTPCSAASLRPCTGCPPAGERGSNRWRRS
ncbi:glycosyltransferase family 39 protein [Thermoflexus sp.]|uniref:glycosyltransferase family 39 protein n=1 Tax=Thermoflexus sp. TaxID=1969742 RepID=UPI0035E4251F